MAELEAWSRPEPSLAVLGHPIGHSLSPAMHNAALAELSRTDGRFAAWRYFRFDIPPDDLARALDLLHRKGFHGVNLTVPHKMLAFGRVAVEESARPIGAVNTLLAAPGGWRGFNTDGYGLAGGLRASLGLSLTGANVLLLGAGGAARGAAIECLERGCAALWIANRSPANRDSLIAELTPSGGAGRLSRFDPAEAKQIAAGAIVINSTSLGLRPADPSPIDLGLLNRPAAVYDMIYNPSRTALLQQAERLGLPRANGLAMLAYQGAKSLEIWTGAPAERTAPIMLAAAQTALDALH